MLYPYNFYAIYWFIIKDNFCCALVVAVTLTSVVILLVAPDSTILSMKYPPVTDVAVIFLFLYLIYNYYLPMYI